MERTDGDYELFMRHLDHAGKQWMDAKFITEKTGWDRRYISSLAQQSKGRVISTGSGYMLQDHASDDDVQAAIALLTSKIAATQERVSEIIRFSHERLRKRVIDQRAKEDPQQRLF